MTLARISDVDGLAMAMVLVLVLSFSVVALLVAFITRQARRRDREVEELLDEVRREEVAEKLPAPSAGTPAAESREPWEKDGDWWKK